MKKTKLVQMMVTLSSSELREFSKYMEGTSYRKSSAVFLLFNYLKKLHPEFPEKKIERSYVQKMLNKKDKGAGNRLADLNTFLSGELENYLIEKKLRERKMNRELIFLDVLRERGLDKMFFNRVKYIEKNWENFTGQGIEDMHMQYLLSLECLSHPNFTDPRASKNIEILERLDNYFLAAKFYTVSNLFSCLPVFNEKGMTIEDCAEQQFLLPHIRETLKKGDLDNRPEQVKVGSCVLEGYLGDTEDFQELKEYILSNAALFNDSEQFDQISFLERVCIRNYQDGKPEFLRELFLLQKRRVESGMVVKGGFISSNFYKYVVLISCALDEIEWASDFVENHQNHLKDEKKESVYAYCKATISFHQGQFDKSIDLLNTVKFVDVAYAEQARALMLQCYYELDDVDLFSNLARSFTAFLERTDSLSEAYISSSKNFIYYAKKLMIAKDHPEPQLVEIRQKLESEKMVNTKKWLLEKMVELEKKKGTQSI